MQQPGGLNFSNTFPPLSNEPIINIYDCQEGCSRCCGPRTTIALTKNRLIMRQTQPSCGCCTGAHADTSIFLQDIQVLREAGPKQGGNGLALLIACITCTWPCLLLGTCCVSCCGDRPKILQVALASGNEGLTFNYLQVPAAAIEITQAIQKAKVKQDRH
ncbi:unnamed protein product [Rotaria sp. Silwood1]|nr:unnamed protein product [Rotaria sp. Silwood1]CAF1673907.1 unnamed protein product [Rotaria sp. Silwood1]CAF3665799.1 unnamed protein product [Rotaria sp. Silwood1]CAF3882994.1 unnamed protein product [Rotaria sp. Silwood1]CAF4581510.1 unnamed protein product [Rotaria sp. Silwood1]